MSTMFHTLCSMIYRVFLSKYGANKRLTCFYLTNCADFFPGHYMYCVCVCVFVCLCVFSSSSLQLTFLLVFFFLFFLFLTNTSRITSLQLMV